MKSIYILFIAIFVFSFCQTKAQDTFSIVCADSVTRQVGSAGASCVDLIAFGITDASFLSDIFPDSGAINSQAAYQPGNQENARYRMREGDTPEQIIEFIKTHDIEDNPEIRQYGIAGFIGKKAVAAGFTGANCIDYKQHITGTVQGIAYSIQGNILLGKHILDSMESRFRYTNGSIVCRLMAALQGAKVIGADTRCAANNSSSLFAFVKVAKPTDSYGKLSIFESYITYNGEMVEPIDELQKIIDDKIGCNASFIKDHEKSYNEVFPNPAEQRISFAKPYNFVSLRSILGNEIIHNHNSSQTLDISAVPNGIYMLITDTMLEKIIIQH